MPLAMQNPLALFRRTEQPGEKTVTPGVSSVLAELALLDVAEQYLPVSTGPVTAPTAKVDEEYLHDVDFFARSRAAMPQLITLPPHIKTFGDITRVREGLAQPSLWRDGVPAWLNPADERWMKNVYFACLNATVLSGALSGGAIALMKSNSQETMAWLFGFSLIGATGVNLLASFFEADADNHSLDQCVRSFLSTFTLSALFVSSD